MTEGGKASKPRHATTFTLHWTPGHNAVYRALLLKFCRDFGFQPDVVVAWAEGRQPIPDAVAGMFERLLELPAEVWQQVVPETKAIRPPPPPRPHRPPRTKVLPAEARAALVSFSAGGQTEPVSAVGYNPGPEHRRVMRKNGQRRRRYPSRVHDVLDELGWTVYELAERTTKFMKKPVSRASMQFYATGTRQQGPKGRSVSQAVQAPLEIRIAVEQLTTRYADRLGLPPGKGRLMRDWWPNVEADDAEPTDS